MRHPANVRVAETDPATSVLRYGTKTQILRMREIFAPNSRKKIQARSAIELCAPACEKQLRVGRLFLPRFRSTMETVNPYEQGRDGSLKTRDCL